MLLGRGKNQYPLHFIIKETEVQEGWVTHSRSHCEGKVRPDSQVSCLPTNYAVPVWPQDTTAALINMGPWHPSPAAGTVGIPTVSWPP